MAVRGGLEHRAPRANVVARCNARLLRPDRATAQTWFRAADHCIRLERGVSVRSCLAWLAASGLEEACRRLAQPVAAQRAAQRGAARSQRLQVARDLFP